MESVLSSQVAITRYPKLGDLEQQKSMFSQLEKTEIKVSARPCSLKALGEALFYVFLFATGIVGNHWPSLACRYFTPVSTSVVTWGSPCVSSNCLPCEYDLYPFKEISVFILLARPSHMATPSCKGVREM